MTDRASSSGSNGNGDAGKRFAKALRVQPQIARFFVIGTALFSSVSVATEPPVVVSVTTDGVLKTRHAWSPDGKTLLFVKLPGSTMGLFVREADGRERRLTDFASPEFDPAWSPDGLRVALSRDITSPNQGNIDVYTMTAAGGEAKRIAGDAGKLAHEESPAWSPDGRSLVFSSTRNDKQQLYIALAEGGEARPLTADNSMNAHPAWSPDGRQIAFATTRWGDWELAVTDVDGKETRRLTESRGLDDYPAWSPDGKQLAFVSNRQGSQGIANYEIFVLDLASGAVRNVSQHSSLDQFPAWTPDGRLSWVSLRGGGHDIVVTEKPLASNP
jgi:TolB protein